MFIEYSRHRGFPAEELTKMAICEKEREIPVGDGVLEAMSRNRRKGPANICTNQSLYYRLHGDG